MTPAEERARAAIHKDRTHDKYWCNLPDGKHSPACTWLTGIWIAGAAAEREAVLAVVRGHRCDYLNPDGHTGLCAEAIARELTEGRP